MAKEAKKSSNKVIITCAVTGAIHTPTMSPHLPITPEEIADAAVGAAEAGAAIIHLHARDPKTGKPDQTPEAFGRFLPQIKQRSNCVVNLTTGGAPTMGIDERLGPAAHFKPEVASLNMGSMNFGLFHLLDRYTKFRFDWEPVHLEATRDLVGRNTVKDIEYIRQTGANNGTRGENYWIHARFLYHSIAFIWKSSRRSPCALRTSRCQCPSVCICQLDVNSDRYPSKARTKVLL